MSYAAIVHALIAAELPATTERIALRLLDMAEWVPSGAGHLALTWDEFIGLSHCTNANAARRHLTALAKAGLAEYRATDPEARSAGDRIRLTWRPPIFEKELPAFDRDELEMQVDMPSLDEPRAVECAATRSAEIESARPRAMECAPARSGETVSARRRAVECAPARTSPHTRANGGGDSVPTDRDPTTTTNHHPAIQKRLRALGLRPGSVAIHVELDDAEIGRILDAWQVDFGDGSAGIGALLHRLRNGLTPPDLERSQAEARRKNYLPAEYAGIILG